MAKKLVPCSSSSNTSWPHKFPRMLLLNSTSFFSFFLYLSLTLSFFFARIIVSLYISYIVHSLQYKVLKCQTKININVTVARIFNKIDPCHSWLKCSVRLNFIWIFFSRDLRSLMFLLLQLISRGKKDGAALFPDKKARREGKESGGRGGTIWNASIVMRSSGWVFLHYQVAEL